MEHKVKKYELPEEEPVMAKEPVIAYAYTGEISTIDALWALIASQARDVQMTLKNRLDRLFSVSEELTPYSMEELLSRINEGERQFEAGEVISGEVVHQKMLDFIESYPL